MARAETETVNRERMKKTAEEEGRRLLDVRAAESAGFWYTVNIEGFDALCTPPRSIPGSLAIDRCPRVLEFEFSPLVRFLELEQRSWYFRNFSASEFGFYSPKTD